MAMMLPMRVDVNALPEQNFSRRTFIPVGQISELRFIRDEFTPAELEVIKSTPFLASRIEAAAEKKNYIGYRDNYKNNAAKLEARQAYNFAVNNPKEFLKSEFPAYLGSNNQDAAVNLVEDLYKLGETQQSLTSLYEKSLPDAQNYAQTYDEKVAVIAANTKSSDPFRRVGRAIDKNIFQPIKNDPVSFAIQAAGAYFGIPPEVTAAAITAAKGGDIEDIGKAAAVAYIAPKVGETVGTPVAGAVANTGMNQTLQQTLVNATASAAAGATSAAIQGGDVGATAISGALGGAGGTLAGEAARGVGIGDKTAGYAETVGRVAAQGGDSEDIGMAIAQQGVRDITKSLKDRPKDQPMTREEIADATFEILQEELAAIEGKESGPGVQVAEATTSDRPPLRIDIAGVGDFESEDIAGGQEDGVPTVTDTNFVSADMDVGSLSDAQIIDLVRAGQRRRKADAPSTEGRTPEPGGTTPESEQVMDKTVVSEGAEGDISDDEILELVRLGMDRSEEPTLDETTVTDDAEDTMLDEVGVTDDADLDGEMELGAGDGEGARPVTPKVYSTPVIFKDMDRRGASLTPRQVGQGYSAIVGDKEPTFGGEQGPQQEVWNERSLRLRKALGL